MDRALGGKDECEPGENTNLLYFSSSVDGTGSFDVSVREFHALVSLKLA